MIRNYLKTAFRTFVRKKGTSLINIIGLSLGITGSILLFLLLQYHTGFDKFQSHYDRIYRVVSYSKGNDGEFNYTSGIPSVLPPAFREDFSEAEEVVFTQYHSGTLVQVPQPSGADKKFSEPNGVVYAEANYFKIFDAQVLSGDVFKSLDEPNEAVICVDLARKYFGKDDVLGEIVKFDGHEFKIGAVIASPTLQTDMPFNLLLSYETIRNQNEQKGWTSIWSDEHCYFLLKEGEDVSKLQARMEQFENKYNPEDKTLRTYYEIQPFSELHFDERYGNYNYNTVSKASLIAIGVIGLFLILTACINFINLATAEAIQRSKEVGIRKTLGSSRGQLIQQFLSETSLITFVALIVSIGFAQIALGFLNPFLELELSISLLNNGGLQIFLLSILVIVSLFSGLYPAFIISDFKPISAIKNKISDRNSSGFLVRQGLVVTQFFISQLLVILTIVIVLQMNYFRNKDLGFRKDAIITIPIPTAEEPIQNGGSSKMRSMANDLLALPGIEKYSLCFAPPSSGNIMGTGFTLEGEDNDKRKTTQLKAADGNYIDLFDLKLIAGKNIDDIDTARGVLVNRKLTEVSGFASPDEIVGKQILLSRKLLPVVGVVENFHTMSLEREISPTILMNSINRYQTISLRINPQTFQSVLPDIQKRWEAAYPEAIFEYQFVDESVKEFYKSEERSSVLLTIFSSLAIAIGCLGLFGLATFIANQKTKEIGVRKVLGASVESIVISFSTEFIKLVLIGFCVAAPIAWYLSKQYLDQFAYKIEMSPTIFIVGLIITVFIAFATVGYRSIRAARANPINSLRSE